MPPGIKQVKGNNNSPPFFEPELKKVHLVGNDNTMKSFMTKTCTKDEFKTISVFAKTKNFLKNNTSNKPAIFSGNEKFHLGNDCIDGSSVDGSKQPVFVYFYIR